jgi:hypothetical protein
VLEKMIRRALNYAANESRATRSRAGFPQKMLRRPGNSAPATYNWMQAVLKKQILNLIFGRVASSEYSVQR